MYISQYQLKTLFTSDEHNINNNKMKFYYMTVMVSITDISLRYSTHKNNISSNAQKYKDISLYGEYTAVMSKSQ